MSLLVDKEEVDNEESRQHYEACLKQLLQSSWCGLLSALSLLLDASTDDTTTETILKHLVRLGPHLLINIYLKTCKARFVEWIRKKVKTNHKQDFFLVQIKSEFNQQNSSCDTLAVPPFKCHVLFKQFLIDITMISQLYC